MTVILTIKREEEEEQEEEIINDFVDLKNHEEKYEISVDYPYIIRNKQTGKTIKESINNAGYIQVNIAGKCYPKHRLIALQFIENDDPENKTEIDHINSNKLDNRIENLIWINHSDNARKRRTFTKQPSEYLTDINLNDYPQLISYKGTQFNRYYYDPENDRLLFKTKSNRVKVIKPTKHNNLMIVSLAPVSGRAKTYGYNKLLRELHKKT